MAKHPGGRPPKYNGKNPEDVTLFANRVTEYFSDCDLREKPYTIPGLALWLGFESRHQILNYEHKFPEFISTIKKARVKIETQRIEKLNEGKCNPAGLIFDLKNNSDYRDKQEIELSGELSISEKIAAARKRLKK
jgi:hypothetical protein